MHVQSCCFAHINLSLFAVLHGNVTSHFSSLLLLCFLYFWLHKKESSGDKWNEMRKMMRKWTFLKLSFTSGFSSYPPKAARRFAFPFFAEVGAKRKRMVTKHKGPWEGETLEVSPISSLSPSFARKFSTRESRLGQQAAPEGESTRTLAEAFIYKHISVANLKNTC